MWRVTMPAFTGLVDDFDSVALRRIRIERNMSQRELGAAMGMADDASSGSNISAYENGRRTPTNTSLRKMSAALECRPSDLRKKSGR